VRKSNAWAQKSVHNDALAGGDLIASHDQEVRCVFSTVRVRHVFFEAGYVLRATHMAARDGSARRDGDAGRPGKERMQRAGEAQKALGGMLLVCLYLSASLSFSPSN
jgi:hypothetical protein